ncbi:capsule-associated protein-like protein CAP1 [Lophiotrema nucula]|uniref:Capsule-associated protein-like protein CAP1 n=1 Tax=Lophiotrema nucula TaxID=690887 RepID=A0A6A5Z776_9PLEO|nr:capsule-associated protein-like protein CAP1 [Lophiotrema nucula]
MPFHPQNYPSERPIHPIDYLMQTAEKQWHLLMAKETFTLSEASDTYRKRRGRHPPPGFDKWFELARSNNALIIEDMWDQIYDDLSPFWGLEPKWIRKMLKHPEMDLRISVRNGNVTLVEKSGKEGAIADWMDIWGEMVNSTAKWLPDLDMALNGMDESRIVVPWETITEYINAERSTRNILPVKEVVAETSLFEEVIYEDEEDEEVKWIGYEQLLWDIARLGCPPDAASRNVSGSKDFSGPPPMPQSPPTYSYHGFVRNFTQSQDPCFQPDLAVSHGSFVEPVSQKHTTKLVPLFGGSKLPMNNEILIPPAMYWGDREHYSGGKFRGPPWDEKKNKMFWRGAGTGGRNRENNWTRFQRHRFVSMVNGTSVQLAEMNREGAGEGHKLSVLKSSSPTGNLGSSFFYMSEHSVRDLGSWLNNIVDAGLVYLECFPNPKHKATCPHTDAYFRPKKSVPMKKMYSSKYLADIDGNSYSGRYLALIRSTSVPIKATIYKEWHDSRLVPWLHFVPMDNSFVDIYGILDYFIGSGQSYTNEEGNEVLGGHDEAGKKIAMNGQEWADRVLRKEDMQLYVMRLLLEWARMCDEKRERLGFVGDLLNNDIDRYWKR